MFEDYLNDAKRYPLNEEIAHMSKENRIKKLKGMIWFHEQMGTAKSEIIEDMLAYTFTYDELVEVGLIKKGE